MEVVGNSLNQQSTEEIGEFHSRYIPDNIFCVMKFYSNTNDHTKSIEIA